MRRPALTESSFLEFLFHPKRKPQPTGLRKQTLTGLRGGRKQSRLNAFNRMSSTNQQALKRSGQRDAYLRGETTLNQAKQSLRLRAIELGVAKPVRQRQTPQPVAPVTSRRAQLEKYIAAHIKQTIRSAGRPMRESTVDDEIVWLDAATDDMTGWTYGQIAYAGRSGSEYERTETRGSQVIVHNPFWYH